MNSRQRQRTRLQQRPAQSRIARSAECDELVELARITGIRLSTLLAFRGPRLWGVVALKLLTCHFPGQRKLSLQFMLPLSELSHLHIDSFVPGDSRLALIMDGYRRGAPVPSIWVYRHCQRWHVIDGHHRLTAARQLERESIWSIGIDLDQVLAGASLGTLLGTPAP